MFLEDVRAMHGSTPATPPTLILFPKRALAAPQTPLRDLPRKLLLDECGGEMMEYALIVGLILCTAIAVVGSLGTKVLAR
jgi:Flp pilus assembly pilin Flp